MKFFGDESGHFNNVLEGETDTFALGVIGGEYEACRHCAAKAVRRIPELDELKWRDLTNTTKRRVMTCIDEQSLQVGYVAFNRERLLRLDGHYRLFQSTSYDQTPWDLIVIGCGYAEIIRTLTGEFDMPATFEFDQIFNQAQSDKICDIVMDEVPRSEASSDLSDRNKGIQVADCVAGAAAEDFDSSSDWLDHLDEANVHDLTDEVLIQVERWLDEAQK